MKNFVYYMNIKQGERWLGKKAVLKQTTRLKKVEFCFFPQNTQVKWYFFYRKFNLRSHFTTNKIFFYYAHTLF